MFDTGQQNGLRRVEFAILPANCALPHVFMAPYCLFVHCVPIGRPFLAYGRLRDVCAPAPGAFMSHPPQSAVTNRILAALPPLEFALLAKHLTRVELALGESLHRAGDLISNVFFV